MPKKYVLDKIYPTNTDYTMSADKALVIRAIGYDTSEELTPKIDGKDLGVLTKDVGPALRVYDFDLPPCPLGSLFYVAPPNKVMRFNATSSANVRVIGDLLELGPGEVLPGNLLSRFHEQGRHFKTYKSGEQLFSAGTPWAAGAWWPFIELVPKTPERYLFADYVGFENPVVATQVLGKHRVRFTLDGKPLDNILTAMGHLGIDVMSMFHPPKFDKNKEPFSLKDFPITVPGDIPLVVEALNNTGVDITAETYKVYMVCEYEKGGP